MKKRMKQMLALLLGTTMVVSLLGGCASKGGNESALSTSATGNGSEAALVADTSEHVDLKMYLVGDKPEGFDDVYAKVNEILEKKLNCSVSVDWLSWAEHDKKYSLLFSSGEAFDMIFTATSWCHFEQTVALGGFKTLEKEFIQTYAPGIWETLPEVAWEQATLNGSIYMVPANYTEVQLDMLALRGDLMAAYGFEDITSYEEMISFFKACAADGKYATTAAGGMYYPWFQKQGYAVVGGAPSHGQLILYHGSDPADTSLKYILDWDDFDEYCREMKEMADAGCWPSDVLSSTADRQDGLMSGKSAGMRWNLGSCKLYANQANAENPEWNANLYNILPDGTYAGTKYINGGIGININSKNPERAMMVLNEFVTNQEIQDLTQLGIEGVNWEAAGDDQYKIIEGNAYNTSNNWGWRNLDIQRAQYLENPTAVDTKAMELEAYLMEHKRGDHVLDGFAFDTTPVSVQYAAVEAAMGTYFDPLLSGLVSDVDTSLEQFRSAMEAAGIREVLTEMQKQVDEYVASRQ